MAKHIFHNLPRLFGRTRERYVVVEELDGSFEITRAYVDHGEKHIRLTDKRHAQNLASVKRPLFAVDRLVVALNPSHATTIESVVRVKRANPQSSISEEELDALVFRGLWDFLNHYRAWASKKMKINELDLVLAGIEIKDVRIGNNRLFNPLGFKGKEFFIRFQGTFIPRSLLPILTTFNEWASDLVVLERGSVLSHYLAGLNECVVHADTSRTSVFVTTEEERIYLKELLWGVGHLVEELAKRFSVAQDVAEEMLSRFIERKVSPSFHRVIDRLVRKHFKDLLAMMSPLYAKLGGNTRLVTHFHFRFVSPYPFSLFTPSLRLAMFDKVLQAKGFKIMAAPKIRTFLPSVHQDTLALLAHTYNHPQYALLNQLLRRRAKWLIPSSSHTSTA